MSQQVRRKDPPYVQIAQQIRADIESGELAAGDPIPSARNITATWGVELDEQCVRRCQRREAGG